MSWLLGQIGLSLLLAAIAGWFIGWYLRAFRDQDRVEDLRQTMIVTKDVKDRELNELRRKAEDLEAQLMRANDASARTAGVASGGVSRASDHGVAVSRRAPGALADVTAAPAADRNEQPDMAIAVAAERDRRHEADAALRRKTAAMLTFQAEIAALRGAVADKASRIAELQERLAGSESADQDLTSTHDEVASLNARLRVLEQDRASAAETAAAQDLAIGESRKELAIRDTRINELRNRSASLETELAAARNSASGTDSERQSRLDDALTDSRIALQKQIDRNRKQELVHRAVVEQLEGDKARLRAGVVAATPPAERSRASNIHRGLPQKRSDELTQIAGVGPAFSRALREAGIDTYAQIATWDESDIESYAALLGAHAKRIRTDRWVEQARELARRSRASRD